MRFVGVVLATLVVVSLTLADEGRLCSLKITEGAQMHSKIAEMAMKCFLGDESGARKLKHMVLMEEFRDFFKPYCERQTIYQTCLDDITIQSESCQNETSHQIFLVFKELLETSIEIGCREDGKIFATIFNGVISLSGRINEDTPLGKCFIDSASRLEMVTRNEGFIRSSQIFFLYHEAVTFRECFTELREGDSDFRDSIEIYLGGIIKRMKCIDPRDNARVICSTITIGGEDGPDYCPITITEDDPRPMRQLLSERLDDCIWESFNATVTFGNIKDLDGYRDYYYEGLCENKFFIKKCFQKVNLMSAVCLNETQHQVFKQVSDILNNGIQYGCVNDGEPLAVITAEVLREAINNTEVYNKPIEPCLRSVKTALVAIEVEDPHTRRISFYRGLRSFRDCFIGRLRGDDMAVFYSQFVFNNMLRELRCIHPDSGSSVMCQSLETTPHPGNRVCPFTPREETDHPFYSMFVDMGITCMNMNQEYFRYLDDMTTLSEYQYFLERYCRRVSGLESCLSNVADNSEVCQTRDEHQMYRIFTDLLDGSLKAGCQGGGGALASFVFAMKRHQETVQPCKVAAVEGFQDVAKQPGNTTAVTMATLRIASDFIDCFSRSIPDGEAVKDESSTFLALMLMRLKCVSLDGAVLPCEAISNYVRAG